MNNLIKVIPEVKVFDLSAIKKGNIYKFEDIHSCEQICYIIDSVTENELLMISLDGLREITLNPDDIDTKFFFIEEMALVPKSVYDLWAVSEEIKSKRGDI